MQIEFSDLYPSIADYLRRQNARLVVAHFGTSVTASIADVAFAEAEENSLDEALTSLNCTLFAHGFS